VGKLKIDLDKVAAEYHLSLGAQNKDFDAMFHKMCLEWIQPMVLQSRSILQLGYGEGILAAALISQDAVMDIIEGSSILASHAKEKLPKNVSVHNQMFEEFCPTKLYDCIVATNVLEHVDDPIEILRLMHSWLSPEGLAIVTVPNAESLHRRLAVEMKIQNSIYALSERDYVVGHQRVYDMSSLVNQVHTAGFKIRERRGFVLKILANAQQNLMSEEMITAFHTISPLLEPEITANIGLVISK
jgi:2-polyprenyl-3-methyl-5-hydroxy-6-metoxy-1,4-benzoquinol methylase